MKKILTIALLGLTMGNAHAQWWNAYSARTGLVLSLHLTDTAAQIYSPLQTSDPIPVSAWSLNVDTLLLKCSSIGFQLNLVRADTAWSGTWKQGMMKEHITFNPTDTLFRLDRPQTPAPPYPFDEETVTADYTDSQGNAVHLEGTLTYPRGGGRYPCLVLVSGSGQQNRNEEIMQHRPFLVLADHLARRGIAVLRYDDRGVGASTGPLDSATTHLFSEDAEAMLRAVSKNRHVDTRRLGMGGHSEGGAIAPLVAARNGKVKFVVMLAGQGCTGREVMVQQNEALFRAAGVSEGLYRKRGQCMDELMALPPTATVADFRTVITRHLSGLTTAEADSIGLKKGEAYAMRQQLQSPWMQAFLMLDPATYLPRVHCPILALNGSRDTQVVPHPNLDRVKALAPHATCLELGGLNHLFQHCTTGSPSEYMLISETFAPEAMQAVADWILGL